MIKPVNLQDGEYQFARDFFTENNYLIIGHEAKPQHVQILAKKLSTGDNVTFFITNGTMYKLCHRNSRHEPWYKKKVASRPAQQMYVEELRAAVNHQDK